MPGSDPMPLRHAVDPLFDGHAERRWDDLTASEKLDWIWTMMKLFRAGRDARRK